MPYANRMTRREALRNVGLLGATAGLGLGPLRAASGAGAQPVRSGDARPNFLFKIGRAHV